MGKQLDNKVVYYYDSHPTEEDLMGETALHAALIHYLVEVLRWLFADRTCAVHENLNFYATSDAKEKPLVPDIAVIKGEAYRYISSWSIGRDGPPPHVVFEIASKETWEKDLYEKPLRYAHLGVSEYVFYDPNEPPLQQNVAQRLLVWQLHRQLGIVRSLPANASGHIWSEQLESWLVPDGNFLRLYDQNGNLRLTQAEAEAQRAALLAEKLRSLGIDPDAL